MELDLSDNAFGPDGVRGFEALLKSSACFTLHELKLNNCGMGIGGGKVGVATPSPTSLCLPSSSLPSPLVHLHPPGVCACHPIKPRQEGKSVGLGAPKWASFLCIHINLSSSWPLTLHLS